jgi:hypothetical protein
MSTLQVQLHDEARGSVLIRTCGFIFKGFRYYMKVVIEYEEYRLKEFNGKVLRKIFGCNVE